MTALIAVPAFGCDARLYAPIEALLPATVQMSVEIADADHYTGCVQQILARAPERFVILGTSFGGRLAIELTLAAPDRVSGLVVIGAGPDAAADPVAGRRRSERLRAGEAEAVVTEMGAIISHLPGPNGPAVRDAFVVMAQTQGSDIMARQSDALSKRTDLWSRLPEICCPSLMLWGVHDQFSPAVVGLRMSTAVAHGRFVELADCGHFPTLEYPEDSAAAISHWLLDSNLI